MHVVAVCVMAVCVVAVCVVAAYSGTLYPPTHAPASAPVPAPAPTRAPTSAPAAAPSPLPLSPTYTPLPFAQVDYDRRLLAYSQLTPGLWSSLGRLQALPLLLTCHYDLRSAQDLALRQGAAQVRGGGAGL